MYSVQKVTYQKACRIKKAKIESAEVRVIDAGHEYLRQIRYSTFIALKHGQESPQYAKSLKSTKKALGLYMKALESCYNAINFDIKEIME